MLPTYTVKKYWYKGNYMESKGPSGKSKSSKTEPFTKKPAQVTCQSLKKLANSTWKLLKQSEFNLALQLITEFW